MNNNSKILNSTPNVNISVKISVSNVSPCDMQSANKQEMSGMPALRTCIYCGKQAFTEQDLEQFPLHKHGKYNHASYCKSCHQKFHNSRQMRFKGKRITLPTNPRLGICSICGKKIPENSNRQMSMHHDFYDESNPLNFTVEMCMHDHMQQKEIHKALRMLRK